MLNLLFPVNVFIFSSNKLEFLPGTEKLDKVLEQPFAVEGSQENSSKNKSSTIPKLDMRVFKSVLSVTNKVNKVFHRPFIIQEVSKGNNGKTLRFIENTISNPKEPPRRCKTCRQVTKKFSERIDIPVLVVFVPIEVKSEIIL